jgi:hypothetical protein
MTADEVLAYNPADVKPGWVAFWIVMALCAATFFLWRSMNRQLAKIRMPPRPSGRPRIGGARETAGTGGEQDIASTLAPPPDEPAAAPRPDDEGY